MNNDEKFIKIQEKSEKICKNKFVLINSIKMIIIFLAVNVLYALIKGQDIRKIFSLPFIIILIIGCITGSIISWKIKGKNKN